MLNAALGLLMVFSSLARWWLVSNGHLDGLAAPPNPLSAVRDASSLAEASFWLLVLCASISLVLLLLWLSNTFIIWSWLKLFETAYSVKKKKPA